MDDDWKPDEKIAETYVRHGELEFQVYTFERNSSAAHGPRRFQETHVYQWDRKERKRGEWLHQLYGHGVAFHNAVVEQFAEKGEAVQETADVADSFQRHQLTHRPRRRRVL
jgi:hypothetical protein